MKRKPLPVRTVDNCDQCGACCTEQTALPLPWYVSPSPMGDPSSLPPELLAELQATLARFNAEGWPADGTPCLWYDAESRRCRHYEHRPELCRTEVNPGDEACLRWRRLKGIDPTRRFRFLGGRLVEV